MNLVQAPETYPCWVLVTFTSYTESLNPPHHDYVGKEIIAVTKVIENSAMTDNCQELARVGINQDSAIFYSKADVQAYITANNFINPYNIEIED